MKIPSIKIPLIAATAVTFIAVAVNFLTLICKRIEYFVPGPSSKLTKPYGLTASNVLFVFFVVLLSVWLVAFFYNNRRSNKT